MSEQKRKQVWKFVLESSIHTLSMPKDSKILTIQSQRDKICIWAMVDVDAEKEDRYFEVYGTGHNICFSENKDYVGTVQLRNESFVFHIFERKKQKP